MTNDVASARDFVGYGETPPDVCWPGGARLAVNVVLNYEEGSEYSIEDGDGRSDATLTEVAQARVPQGLRRAHQACPFAKSSLAASSAA